MNFEHIQHVLLLRTSLEVRMDHSFSMYAKFPKRIKNVCSLENFAYVPNE